MIVGIIALTIFHLMRTNFIVLQTGASKKRTVVTSCLSSFFVLLLKLILCCLTLLSFRPDVCHCHYCSADKEYHYYEFVYKNRSLKMMHDVYSEI